jgi:hypothetical protein
MATFTTPDGRTLNVVGSLTKEGQKASGLGGKSVGKRQLDTAIKFAGEKGRRRANY